MVIERRRLTSAWRGALPVIEAAYRAETDETVWLRGVTDAATALGERPYAYTLDMTPESPALVALTGDPELAERLGRAAMFALGALPMELIRAYHSIDPLVDISTTRAARIAERRDLDPDWLQTACQGFYPVDSLGMIASDPVGPHVMLLAFHEIGSSVPPRLTRPLTFLSSHLASALRLRRALAPEIEAVIDADGNILDAAGPVKESREARKSLSEAALRLDRARLRKTSPEEALTLWDAMVDGEWTIVENIERDGKRLMLARRNQPQTRPMMTLSMAERQVASYAAHAHSYKLIAYELGMPVSTVATHLASALQKLGFPSRAALIAARLGQDSAKSRAAVVAR